MKHLKILLIYFLIGIFSLHSIGHFVLLGTSLCAWKYEVKHQFLNDLSADFLVKIQKNEQFELLENGHELEQNGLRYDIVRVSKDTYFCYKDVKENNILSALFDKNIQKESKANSHQFSILKDIFKYYIIDNQYFKYFYFHKMLIINVFKTIDLSPTYLATFLIPPMI